MLHIAIIGTGAISDAHINGYLRFPGRCKITALCDLYPEKAEAKNREYGLNAKVVTDYKELLHSGIDLVSICLPPYEHARVSVDWLRAGSHVLVEKPMASSLEECDRMIEAARQSGKLLSVVAQNRFTNPMMKLKQMLDTGLAGPILHAQVDSFWWRGHCYYDLWWRGTWEKEGGGCTLNHAVHHIDALIWMTGRPERIQAVMGNGAHDNAEVEDLSVALLQYPNGLLAQVTSSVVHHGEEQQLVFQGKQARISAPWKVRASLSTPNGFPETNDALERQLRETYETLPDLPHQGHAGQIDNVLSAIETGSPPLIGGDSGRATLETIAAIYKAASTGESVSLPLASGDPFYTREGVQANAIRFYEKSGHVENFADPSITLGTLSE